MKMKKFIYKGIEFEPLLRLTNKDSSFREMSHYTSKHTEIKGFTHEEFYKIAKENGCGEIDLFRVNGIIITPCNNGYFNYYNSKILKRHNLKFNTN